MRKALVIFCLVLSLNSFGQDPHWSTIANHQVLQNPAFLTSDSVIHAGIVYRTQWSGITDPFQTVGLFAGIPLEKPWTVGLNVWDDRSGNVGWSQTNLRLQVAWETEWENIQWTFAGGLGFDQRSIDTDKLVFPDQINDDLSISQTNELIDGTISNLDNSLGVKSEIQVRGKPLILGASLDHLISTNQGFIGEAKIPLRWNATATYPFPITNHLVIQPFTQWQIQRRQQHFQGGLRCMYQFMDYQLSAGSYYRLGDALITEVGVANEKWKAGIAYDQSLNSTLTKGGRNANAWEFFIGFRIPEPTPEPITIEEPPKEVETIVPIYHVRWVIRSIDSSAIDSVLLTLNGEPTFLFSQELDHLVTPWFKYYQCESAAIKVTAPGFSYYKDSLLTPCPMHIADSTEITVLLAPLKKNNVIRLENIYFSFNSDTLSKESREELDELSRLLEENSTISIEIAAHTDSVGNNLYNQLLSQRRAERCVTYLMGRGINPARLDSKGYGSTKPVAPNTHPDGSDNPEGRAKNRRVEFKIIKE